MPFNYLSVVVFISGAVVMIMELVASRVIAPYLGTSILIWTSLIGIILAALSIGYYLGGKVADRWPNPKVLAVILFIASLFILLTSYTHNTLKALQTISNIPPELGSIIIVLLLFAPASIALGTVTPFAMRLTLANIADSGKTIGKLGALSNIGSIIGTFLGGFYLVSAFGSTTILLLLASIVFLLSLGIYIWHKFKLPIKSTSLFITLFLLSATFPSTVLLDAEAQLVAEVDTRYNKVWVYDTVDVATNRPVRVLTDSVYGQQASQFIGSPFELVPAYLKFYDLAQALYPDFTQTLLIGGSAYTYPTYFLHTFPKKTMDVVEIDPTVTKLAREYFHLQDNPHLKIFHEDGRTFLNSNKKMYQVILLDMFHADLSIPFHLTTKEAVELLYSSLDDRGLVIGNIVSALEGHRAEFLQTEYATYKSVFPFVTILQVTKGHGARAVQNLILVASKKPISTKALGGLSENVWDKPLISKPPLTDNYAPVENFAVRMLF